MKRSKDYTLLALAIPIGIAVLFNVGLSCEIKKDKQPEPVVNNCPYENLECPNANKYARDYQLELLSDSTEIWQGDRLVATIHYTQSIDSILLLDNQ